MSMLAWQRKLGEKIGFNGLLKCGLCKINYDKDVNNIILVVPLPILILDRKINTATDKFYSCP